MGGGGGSFDGTAVDKSPGSDAQTPSVWFLASAPSIQGAAWLPLHSWKDAPGFLLVTDVDFHLHH